MADKPTPIHVEIFGQSYAVRAGTDPKYIVEVAAYVDAQMRDVSRSAGAVDSVRIAVLAALNIADECFTLRASLRETEERTRRRADGLARTLAAVVDASI